MTQFAEFLETSQGCTLREADSDMVRNYMSWMQGRGKSTASVTRFLASVKSFYNYLMAQGDVKINPAKGVAAAKVERKYPEILTSKEVELFLEQPQCVDAKGFRDHAMLELLYATGIRVSELISLDMEDLNLAAGFIRCENRGKERIIPLYHAAVKAIQEAIGVEPTGEASATLINIIMSDAAPGYGTKYWKHTQNYSALKIGDSGDEVTELQVRLYKLGYLAKEDVADSVGTYEEFTAAAVNAVMKEVGCRRRDGSASSEFLTVLYAKASDSLKK